MTNRIAATAHTANQHIDRTGRAISAPRDLSATHRRAYIADIKGEVLYFKTEDTARDFGATEVFPVMVSIALYDTLS